MKKLVFLACLLALPMSVSAFETPAKQAMLLDATTGTTLLAKQADERMAPSSMSKMMTVYLALEKLKSGELKPDDTFHVSEKAWKMGGSKMFVHVGDKVAVQDLLRGIAIQSGNDACIVVAEGIAGTEEAFAELMNAKAKQLGLTGSHFMNSNGWPDDNHYMTARDLVRLAQALIRDFPEYYPLWSEREFTYSNITQPNRNTLLGEMGVDGIKTGHTEAGGFGITTSAEQNGRRLISVVNGLDSMAARIEASRQLLSYGFNQFEATQLFAQGKPLTQAKIWLGNKNEVALMAEKLLLVTLPKGDKTSLKFTAQFKEPLVAPIVKGQPVGTLTMAAPDRDPITVALVAAESVSERSAFARILPNLHYLLFGAQ